jgi:hypothetical protein
MGTNETLSLREGYDRGGRSQRTQTDWDDALIRFSNKYCTHSDGQPMCALEHAWCDGWDDAGEVNSDRRPVG